MGSGKGKLAKMESMIPEETSIDSLKYRLVGVLIHSGSADAGHYYSYIKERNPHSPNYGSWFEFNDTRVIDFDIKNLKMSVSGARAIRTMSLRARPSQWGLRGAIVRTLSFTREFTRKVNKKLL